MAERATSRPRRGRRRAYGTAALAGAATLAVALSSGCSKSADASDGAGAAGKATPVSVLSPSVPDHIKIPSLKVDADLGTVGLDSKGVMDTPPYDKPLQADWYKQGPTPGEKGAAAVVGHMDTPDTPKAVFYNLKELKKDAEVDVRREDGTTAVFTVDSVETFKKDAFPTDKVYGKTDKAELRLITCGGDLTKSRHWDSNVVVFAHLTGKA
ncbi:class F sortase [Streptomyces sp. NPDC001941]|uniref:class F sortase n=1 Tax=Streptomyces sp. NPDC001941 TaxID=3154659 RepID=UPI003317C1F1